MTRPETTSSKPTDLLPPTPESLRTLPRRSMLVGIAAAGVSLPFLVSCGSSNGGSSNDPKGTHRPPSRSPSTSSGASGDGAKEADILTPVSAVDVGGGVILPAKNTVVTQPTKGVFEGFSATCTHMGCIVANIQDGRIICPCHGSMYSIKTGDVLGGPAPRPLPKKQVKVVGANVVSA
jgi:Rieske Fe-S protein